MASACPWRAAWPAKAPASSSPGLTRERSAEPAAGIGSTAHGVVADTRNLADIDGLIEETRRFGGASIDVVFANARIACLRAADVDDGGAVRRIDGRHVKGVYFTVQKAVPLMKAGSAIILNASIATSRGNPAGSIYGASRRQCVRWHAPSAPNSSAGHLRQRHQSRPDRDADLRPLRNERRAQAELKAAWAARKPMKRFGSVD